MKDVKIDRFWSHEASNIRCVREADYDRLEQECERLRECTHDRVIGDFVILDNMAFNKAEILTQRTDLCDAMEQRDAALKQVEGLRAALADAGNPLSNAAYNLAQKVGYTLTSYDCELLSELRKRWDAALQAKP